MLTKIENLNIDDLSTELAVQQSRIETILALGDVISLGVFGFVNDELEIERLAICSLDGQEINAVLCMMTTKEDLRSLFLHYTDATSLQLFVESDQAMPDGDDWTVVAMNVSTVHPEARDVPAYDAVLEGNHLTLTQGDNVYVGTVLHSDSMKMLNVLCAGEYDDEVRPALDLAEDWCARNKTALVLTAPHVSWLKPLTDRGFSGLRWTLRVDRNRL